MCLVQVIALNGYCSTMPVELNEATANNEANVHVVDAAADKSCWESEVDVMYDVDESPPVSLCLLLGFQVSRNHRPNGIASPVLTTTPRS